MAKGFRQMGAESDRVRKMREDNKEVAVYAEMTAENTDKMKHNLSDNSAYTEMVAENTGDINNQLRDLNAGIELGIEISDDIRKNTTDLANHAQKMAEFASRLKSGVGVDTEEELQPIPNNSTAIVEIIPQDADFNDITGQNDTVIGLLGDIRDNISNLSVPGDADFDDEEERPTNNNTGDRPSRDEPKPVRKRDKAFDFVRKGFVDIVGSIRGILAATRLGAAMLKAVRMFQATILLGALLLLIAGIDYLKLKFGSLKESLYALRDYLGEKFDKFKSWFGELWDNMKNMFTRMVDYFAKGHFTRDLSNAVHSIWERMKDMFMNFIDNFMLSFGKIMESIPGMGEAGRAMQADALMGLASRGRILSDNEINTIAESKHDTMSEKSYEEATEEERFRYYDSDGNLKSKEQIASDLGSQNTENMNKPKRSQPQEPQDDKVVYLTDDEKDRISMWRSVTRPMGDDTWMDNDEYISKVESGEITLPSWREIDTMGYEKDPVEAPPISEEDSSRADKIDEMDTKSKSTPEMSPLVNNSVNMNNSSTKIVHTGPPQTNIPQPGYVNNIA